MSQPIRLYHYWRSSSSWRVRWAFALKKIDCEYVPVDLLSGENESPEHLSRNPLGYVPVLEWATQPPRYLAESLAIIYWAEEAYPNPTLLPGSTYDRAWIRQLAEIITSDTQPLQNLGPQQLHSDDPEKRKKWAQYWIHHGLSAYEQLLQKSAGLFSFQDELTLADLCLIPQCYNALRYEVPLEQYPMISKIYAHALQTESYRESEPERFKPCR